jgi:uncharacterized protein
MEDITRPLPYLTPDNRLFWKYAAQHELRMQKCPDCGHIRYPASMFCSKCLSEKTEWIKLSGKGTVYTFGVTRHVYDKWYADKVPYIIAIIELAEGPHMMGQITGCRFEDVQIGMPVEIYFQDVNEDIAIPAWRPVN